MAKCNKCGAQVPDGSKFCNVCGASVVAVAPQPGASQNTVSMPQVREFPQSAMQQPGYGLSTYGQPPASKKSRKTLIILAVLVVLGGFYFYSSSSHNEQQPIPQQPGTQQPGTQQPGTQQPGTQQPGTQQPGIQLPGTQQPSTQQPPAMQPLPQQPSSPQTGGSSSSNRQVILNYLYELEPQIQQLYQEAQNVGGQEVSYEVGILAQEIQEVGNGIQGSDPYGYNLLALDYQRLTCIFSIAMRQDVQQAAQIELQLRQQLQQAIKAYQQGIQ